MRVIQSPMEMQQQAREWKQQGLKIALVPTMGCLHAGHLSLMRLAAQHADRVVVSIFVNPLQFGPNEDFDAYPRQFETDCNLVKNEKVSLVFHPDAREMYPAGFQTTVSVKNLSVGMCGADRPGHFDGVATVVAQLLHLTCADVAVFGQKDFQQLAIIKQMARDLRFPATIIGAPIIREDDGLAMSSRNKYLKGEMRHQALCLYESIQAAKRLVDGGGGNVTTAAIIELTRKTVEEAGCKLEYAVVVNEQSLQAETVVGHGSVLAIAVKVGGTVRLIDNAQLLPGKMR